MEHHLRVLVTSDLDEEYRLCQKPMTPEPDIKYWLHPFPLAWAETGGMGLAQHQTPIYIEIKAGAEPLKVHQYPKSQEAKRGITPPHTEAVKAGSPKTDSVHLKHTPATN